MQKGTPTTDRIGSYRVIRELSVMGSVQVHLACEDAPDAPSENVVLKVVPNAPGRDAKDTQKLIRELTVCSRMTHPGIARTRKVFKHATPPFSWSSTWTAILWRSCWPKKIRARAVCRTMRPC